MLFLKFKCRQCFAKDRRRFMYCPRCGARRVVRLQDTAPCDCCEGRVLRGTANLSHIGCLGSPYFRCNPCIVRFGIDDPHPLRKDGL